MRKQLAAAPEGAADTAVLAQLAAMKGKFEAAMNDDLNTAVALSIMFEMVRLVNSLPDSGTSKVTLEAIDTQFRTLGGEVLGIVKDEYAAAGGGDEELLDHLIGLMIEQRQTARKNKDFAASDAIRDKLAAFGILLEDKPGGITTWRRA